MATVGSSGTQPPIIILAFPSQCLDLSPGSSHGPRCGWSFCFSWLGLMRKMERGVGSGSIKSLLGIISQKSTYTWAGTWSYDQPLLKGRLGNIG